jgi:CMP-2-keto-3-deoxyoctulosonic acid synthetase
MARYFSRAPIPWVRGRFASPPGSLPDDVTFLRHLGLYAYRVATLRVLAESEPCELERAESLEQLRALWLGISMVSKRSSMKTRTSSVTSGTSTAAARRTGLPSR